MRGPQNKVLWSWIAVVRCVRHAIVVHENVESFPISEFMDFLQDLYFHIRFAMDARTSGFAAYRLRVWDIMILRAVVDPTTRSVPRNLNRFEWFVKTLFFCTCTFDWTEFLQASDEDVEAELQWALFRKLTKEWNDEHGICIEKAKARGSNVALLALNPSDRCRLVTYKAIRPGRIYDVGQEPTGRPKSSDRSGRMPTLMKGAGLMVFDDTAAGHTRAGVPARWMTAYEMFESMGFPIQRHLQQVCCGAHHAYSHGRPWKPFRNGRSQMSQQIWNSQHVAVVGPIHFVLLLLFPIVRADQWESSVDTFCPDTTTLDLPPTAGTTRKRPVDEASVSAGVSAVSSSLGAKTRHTSDSSSRFGNSSVASTSSGNSSVANDAFREALRRIMRNHLLAGVCFNPCCGGRAMPNPVHF